MGQSAYLRKAFLSPPANGALAATRWGEYANRRMRPHPAQRVANVRDLDIASKRRIRVREYGGDGLPLVMLHGLLASGGGGHEVAGRSPRPCFALDLPGFGGSTCPPYERIGGYARDVGRAIDSLGLERF